MKALIVNRETYEVLCNNARSGCTSGELPFYFQDMIVCDDVLNIKAELNELKETRGLNPSMTTIETARIMKAKKDALATTP